MSICASSAPITHISNAYSRCMRTLMVAIVGYGDLGVFEWMRISEFGVAPYGKTLHVGPCLYVAICIGHTWSLRRDAGMSEVFSACVSDSWMPSVFVLNSLYS